ncbi:sulfite oxidase [Pusillimonas sp. CC-YST705]|uniref:Sulfite oxidase n=1 Tax=Mesopusillimonas faecipullorum TaxID=2755040 RepID=A0ABS8CF10_9BURK|nr:sulfite oxidase [Mesopusillimonas faecipullorum]MCB5364608.1 sulfite oxidase [Mesopusillimonas faecipullorum]
MEHITNSMRRRLLATAGGAVAWAGLGGAAWADSQEPASKSNPGPVSAQKPLPAYADWKDADALIVHSANTIETRRAAVGTGGITPLDKLFIRNNVSPPPASIMQDPGAWVLEVSGVAKPRSFTLAELKTLGLVSVAMVLQCSGNGRAYFPHKPSGTQWTTGAAGCVVFTGVPLKAVLEAVGGAQAQAKFITGTGGEAIPAGIDANTVAVERSVPLSVLDDALLAWEINGEPLPLAHGGPLRLVVPGYTGVNSVKYIKKLAFTEEMSPARIQQSSYRYSPVGAASSPEHEVVWAMPPKSWITQPSEGSKPIQPGRVMVTGVALGGTSAPAKVEVSLDGGKKWHEAAFVGPDLGKYAWRTFALIAELSAGEYELVSRVTNAAGETQPEERLENNRGYNNNSWRDHGLVVQVA